MGKVYGTDGNKMAAGVIWQVKPYYWIEKNQSKGIIAESFKYIKDGCPSKRKDLSNLEEIAVMSSLSEFYKTFTSTDQHPYDSGSLLGVTSLTARWLPVIQEFSKETMDNRSMTEKTLFTEPKSSVVVHKMKISLFYKLKLGILKTQHILVLSFLCAIIFAILVWFAVSVGTTLSYQG